MEIKGKALSCDLRFIRAWIHASICMMHYHNCPFPIDITTLKIEIKDLTTRVNKVNGETGLGGTANWAKNRIELSYKLEPESMANVILHEVIHLGFRDFGHGTLEFTTRTLETKLKPLVQKLAQPLINNTQKAAAYIAHTKPGMAYRNGEGKDDFYNEKGAWERVGAKDKYGAKKRRLILKNKILEIKKEQNEQI
jgi:hypothetical protein